MVETDFEKLTGAGVTLFPYVPDFGNDDLVRMADADMRTQPVLLSSEQEGVALCAGADLVGGRGVLLMQSSGVGNCPNMLSLIQGGRFPMLMIVTMRGDYGEQNPWQYPMGRAVIRCWRPWVSSVSGLSVRTNWNRQSMHRSRGVRCRVRGRADPDAEIPRCEAF